MTHFVNTFITGKPFVLGVLVSPEMKKHGLDQAHFDALLGLGTAGAHGATKGTK